MNGALLMKRWIPVFVFTLMLSAKASASSIQKDRLTIVAKNVTISRIFKVIKKQTGLTAFYNNDLLDDNERLDVNFTDAALPEVLRYILRGKGISWTIQNGFIVLKKSNPNIRSTTANSNAVPPLEVQLAIRGKVTDQKNEPLIGVTVKLKGASLGTITDINGDYSLTLSEPDAILVFSYIGFETQEVNTAGRTVVNITMKEDVSLLGEVVVVGYGTQEKASLTTAVESISSEELANQSTSGDLRKTLQGMAPGLAILDNGGQPGNNRIQMQIRGVSSVNGSEPLVLVDGQVQSLNDIDPNSIESISVLKDAASTAIYGSRGSNGIILVTTKKGQKGALTINIESTYGIQQPTVLPEFISTEEFLRFRNILAANEKMRNPKSNLPTYTEEEIAAYLEGMKEDPVQYPAASYDLKKIYRPAPQSRQSLTVSGGGDFVQTMANLSYFYQEGLIWERNYERVNLRMNNNFTLSKRVSAHLNLFYQTSERNTQATGFPEFEAVQGLHNPTKKYALGGGLIYDADGNYLPKGARKTNPRLEADTKYMGLYTSTPHYATVDLGLDWNPVKGLKLSGMYAVQNTDLKEEKNIPRWDLGFTASPNNSLSFLNRNAIRTTFNALANYDRKIGKHVLSALAGYAIETYKNESQEMYGQDFFNNEIRNISTGSQENISISNTLGEWGLISYFGRFAYNFNEKYYAEVSLRSDGSSRFPGENRYSQFPGAAVAWRISKEDFFKGLQSVVSDLKIRTSYGQTGSHDGVGNYSYIPQLALNQRYGFATGPGGEYVVNTIIQNTLASEELYWEKVTQLDVGVDMALLEDKFNVSFDMFDKTTNGILLDLPIPGVVGLNPSKTNAGKIQNKGWELSMKWRSAVNDFQYSIGAGIASVEDKLVDYGGLGITNVGGGYSRWEGSPLFAIRGYKTLGIYQTDAEAQSSANLESWAEKIGAGDFHYEDVNHDGVIDWDNDSQLLGDRTPRYTYNINLSVKWNGFDLSMLWNGASDVQTIITGYLGEGGQWNNSPISVYWRDNYWSKEGDTDVHFSRPLWRQSNNTVNNSRDVNDADYFRLKSLVFGYTLPAELSRNIRLEKVRVFFNGTNLLTFSELMRNWGVDPEDAPLTGATTDAPRHLYPPQLKTFNFGLNVQL